MILSLKTLSLHLWESIKKSGTDYYGISRFFTRKNKNDTIYIRKERTIWGGGFRTRPHADGLTGGNPRDAGEWYACQIVHQYERKSTYPLTGTCFSLFWMKSLFASHSLQLIQNGVGYFRLGHDGEFFHVVSGDQSYDVGIGTEAGTADLQVIGHDHVSVFLF